MYHMLAWTVSAVDAVETDITPVPDNIIPVINAHFLPADDLDLYFACAMSTGIDYAKISTPKLRQVSLSFIRPVQNSLVGVQDQNVAMYFDQPVRLRQQEEIVMLARQTTGGPVRITIVAGMGRGREPVPAGDVYVIRFTSTTAAVANAWTLIAYTLDQQLPSGKYAVIGSEVFDVNGQAHRITFDNQFYRPGNINGVTAVTRQPYPMYQANLGVMGYFFTYSLPRVEVLCNSAATAHEGYFRIVKLS